jgi:hypothetical protein
LFNPSILNKFPFFSLYSLLKILFIIHFSMGMCQGDSLVKLLLVLTHCCALCSLVMDTTITRHLHHH